MQPFLAFDVQFSVQGLMFSCGSAALLSLICLIDLNTLPFRYFASSFFAICRFWRRF